MADTTDFVIKHFDVLENTQTAAVLAGVFNVEDECLGYAALRPSEARKLARMLSPLYVVKSSAGCYATYSEDISDSTWEIPQVAWTEQRRLASHFTSKKAAFALKRLFGSIATVYRVF